MHTIAPGHATSALRAMFPRHGHAWRRCFAVFDGSAGGTILADDPDAPSWAAVHELSDDGSLFLAGELPRELVADIIERLRRERTVVVAAALGDSLFDVLPDNLDYDGSDRDFEDRDPAVDLARLAVPPPDLRLARIDAELAPRCIWGPWMSADIDAALRHGLGYCLLDDDIVVAEAFAGPNVEGALEMGVITHADYRGRGLATIVSARTALECERHGLRTWWNTATTNHSSTALARKLGYRKEREYRVVAWLPPHDAESAS